MMLWLTEIPSWVSFILTIVVMNVVALSIMMLARGLYRRAGITAGPAVVSAWATCAGALCAVLFAFTIITLWSTFSKAQTNVNDEVAAIRLVARDIAPAQLPLLQAYVTESAAEWGRMCGGTPDARVVASLSALERLAQPRAPEYAGDLYTHLGAIEDLRNQRWRSASTAAPTEIIIALTIVALMAFCVLAIALPEHLGTHVALMAAIATALGAVFWVMIVMEYPYCGSYNIGPDQMLSAAHMLAM